MSKEIIPLTESEFGIYWAGYLAGQRTFNESLSASIAECPFLAEPQKQPLLELIARMVVISEQKLCDKATVLAYEN